MPSGSEKRGIRNLVNHEHGTLTTEQLPTSPDCP